MAVKASATISIFNVDDGTMGETGVGVDKLTAYYAVGASGTTKPSAPSTTGWSTTLPTVSETQYLWLAYLVTYTDGTTAWTEPYCVTDVTTRERVTTLETDLTVVQGQISSKVWQTDIDTAVEDVSTTMTEKFSEINQTVDGITLSVSTVEAVTDDLSQQISNVLGKLETSKAILELDPDKITSLVESKLVTEDALGNTIEETKSSIKEQTAEAIKLQFDTVSSQVTETADALADAQNELHTYIRFSSSGIELGKQEEDGSVPFSARLTNEELAFYDGSEKVAYVSNNKLYITNAEVTGESSLAGFGFKKRSNGHGIIRWRG